MVQKTSVVWVQTGKRLYRPRYYRKHSTWMNPSICNSPRNYLIFCTNDKHSCFSVRRRYHYRLRETFLRNFRTNLACVADVKRGRGNLSARERPNSLPLPFRTPATRAIRIRIKQSDASLRYMEFLRSLLWRHFARKPVVVSRNVGCFLMLGWISSQYRSYFFC